MHTLTKAPLSELNSAVFRFLIRCLLEQDMSALMRLGIVQSDVSSLTMVRLGDMHHLSGITNILSTNRISNRDGLYKLIAIMTQPSISDNDENAEITKECELNESILRLLARNLSEGNIHALEVLGVEQEDIEMLPCIRVADVARISHLEFHLLAPDIVLRDPLLRAISCIRRAERDDECCEYLIRHDAPLPLASTLFGLTGGQFSNMRRMYDVKGGVGRTRDLTTDEEDCVWSIYLKLEKSVDDLSPSDWITLHKRTSLPLRNIWLFLQHLQQETSIKMPNNDRVVATTSAKAFQMER